MASAAAIGAGTLVAPHAWDAARPVNTPQFTPVAATSKHVSRRTLQRRRADAAVRYAYQHIGDPYRYGAAGPRAWDCSGLAGGVWRKAGVRLPRTSQQIYRAVRYKVSWKGAVAGDLLFFYGGRTHVGIYVGRGYMIHAPHSGTRVRRVKLNSYYRREFAGAVRPGY